MRKIFKLAIFDMDGTVLNTLGDLAAASNYALRMKGFPEYSVEAYKEFIGHGPFYLVEHALPPENRDDETIKSTAAEFFSYYALHSLDITKPYDGILDAMRAIKEAGVKIAVYSNKNHDDAVRLSGIFFPGLVDMPVGLSENGKPKPDPSAGFEIMKHFGATAGDTVYIGDSGVDMMTGKALGVYTVGVSWGFRPKDELEERGADVIIDKASDIVKIILDK